MARRKEIFGLDPNLLFLGALGIGAFLIFSKQIVHGVISGAASVVKDVTTGAVIGMAEAVGIPETNATQCEAALSAGNYYDASFYCPAGKFLKSASGAIYDTVTGALLGISPATGHASIVGIQFSAQIPGEFGSLGPFATEGGNRLPGISPGDVQISDWPAA